MSGYGSLSMSSVAPHPDGSGWIFPGRAHPSAFVALSGCDTRWESLCVSSVCAGCVPLYMHPVRGNTVKPKSVCSPSNGGKYLHYRGTRHGPLRVEIYL